MRVGKETARDEKRGKRGEKEERKREKGRPRWGHAFIEFSDLWNIGRLVASDLQKDRSKVHDK